MPKIWLSGPKCPQFSGTRLECAVSPIPPLAAHHHPQIHAWVRGLSRVRERFVISPIFFPLYSLSVVYSIVSIFTHFKFTNIYTIYYNNFYQFSRTLLAWPTAKTLMFETSSISLAGR